MVIDFLFEVRRNLVRLTQSQNRFVLVVVVWQERPVPSGRVSRDFLRGRRLVSLTQSSCPCPCPFLCSEYRLMSEAGVVASLHCRPAVHASGPWTTCSPSLLRNHLLSRLDSFADLMLPACWWGIVSLLACKGLFRWRDLLAMVVVPLVAVENLVECMVGVWVRQ